MTQADERILLSAWSQTQSKSGKEGRLMFALYVAAKNVLAICFFLDKSLFKSLFGNIRERPSHHTACDRILSSLGETRLLFYFPK